MHGHLIAVLSKQHGRLALVYSDEARDTYDVNTPLLSVALPVRPETFKDAKVRPFFDGLLPEGEARRMLAYDFRVSEDDTFGLLRALGRDCAGALVILPEGEALPEQVAGAAIAMSEDEVAVRLRQLETEPLGVDQQVRISLAGVQHKLVLSQLSSGRWTLPINGRPSTHILKRANPRFAHMVANEAYCLAVGRHLGLQVTDAAILQIPEEILVVTRYDREKSGNDVITRIHQEDLTQAFAIGSSAKYEEHGGPGLRTIARLLRDETVGSESLEALLGVTLLNMIVGNADAHAKNFSLLHPEPGIVRLAPAYDIMSTTYYPGVSVRPGMYVNRKTSILEVTTTDVIAEATAWGLHKDRVRARVANLLARLPDALEAAARDVPSAPADLLNHVRTRAEAFIAQAPTMS
jgi:serine/threonine-protein kinase HipA